MTIRSNQWDCLAHMDYGNGVVFLCSRRSGHSGQHIAELALPYAGLVFWRRAKAKPKPKKKEAIKANK